MAITEDTFNGDGSNLGPFTFIFPWLESTDIKVSVGGTVKTPGTHYNLQGLNYSTRSGGEVLFTAGNAPGVGTDNIRIYRDTDDTALAATFFPGSAIRSQDLNENFRQSLYVAQETKAITVQAATGNLPNGSITSNLIADGSITTNLIAAGAVTDAKIADNSVTGVKLADGSVTAAKLSTSYLPTAGGTLTGTVTFAAGQTFPITGNTVTVTAVSKTLTNLERCTVTASGQTITLPTSPQAGWEVTVFIAGSFTDTVIARNGENIMSLAQDMTVDRADSSVTLFYVDATRGWRII